MTRNNLQKIRIWNEIGREGRGVWKMSDGAIQSKRPEMGCFDSQWGCFFVLYKGFSESVDNGKRSGVKCR